MLVAALPLIVGALFRALQRQASGCRAVRRGVEPAGGDPQGGPLRAAYTRRIDPG